MYDPLARNRLPPSAVSALFVGAVCFSLLVVALASACTKTGRMDTIRTTLGAVNAARDGFKEWDIRHQRMIVEVSRDKAEAQKDLASYREERRPVSESFELAYASLAVAATQTDEPSLKRALTESANLLTAVRAVLGEPHVNQ